MKFSGTGLYLKRFLASPEMSSPCLSKHYFMGGLNRTPYGWWLTYINLNTWKPIEWQV